MLQAVSIFSGNSSTACIDTDSDLTPGDADAFSYQVGTASTTTVFISSVFSITLEYYMSSML